MTTIFSVSEVLWVRIEEADEGEDKEDDVDDDEIDVDVDDDDDDEDEENDEWDNDRKSSCIHSSFLLSHVVSFWIIFFIDFGTGGGSLKVAVTTFSFES